MLKSKNALASLQRWLLCGEPPKAESAAEGEALAATAREQGLAGLLREALGPRDVWPASLRQGLQQAHRAALARGVRQLDMASRVLALLETRGLRALPLKGAALAEALYGSVADRPMADVDVLVLDDAARALALLLEHGFREIGPADHAWGLIDPHSGGVLELHWSVTSCPGLFPLDREGLWARSRPAAGQVPRIPSAEDLLVQLSLHASFQHGLALSLVQYLDFRRLFERASLDPDRLRAIAAVSRAEAAVAAALAAAQAVVGAPVPRALASEFPLPRPLARWLSVRLTTPLSLLIPSAPALARVRWGLLPGRRLELARRSLWVHRPGPPEPFVLQGLRAAGRAGRLVRRWVRPSRRAGPGGWTAAAPGDGWRG